MPIHVGTDLEPDTPELDVEAEKPARATLQVEFTREELALLRQATGRGPGLVRFVKSAALEAASRKAKTESPDSLHAAD